MSTRTPARRFAVALALAGAFALTGCPGKTQMVFDLSGAGGFYALPFPLDFRLDAEGRPDLTGFPNPSANPVVDLLATVAHEDARGWSTGMPIYLAFTRPIDTPQLPADPRAFEDPASPIQLIDVDPASPERGRRFPLRVTLNAFDQTYRVGNLLQIIPVLGVELREETTYAAIVTDGAPAFGFSTLVPNPDLTAVLFGVNPGGALGAEAVDTYAPLRDQLALEGVNPATIVGATVFTTGAPSRPMLEIAAHLDTWPAPAPDAPPVFDREYDEYCVLEGTWTVPMFQEGTPPYYDANVDGGAFQFDEDGNPEPQTTRTSPFVVTIPKRAMPAAGFPLLMYIHGTGGIHTQVYTRGRTDEMGNRDIGGGPSEIAAERGWGSAGMGGHLAPEHIGDASLDGYIAYNFFNPRAMRDNFLQMVSEEILFRRLLTALSLDASLCPGADASAAPDGRLRFDPDMQAVMGQSLGSYLTGMVVGADPRPVQGAIPTGAGGSWIEFALGPKDPFDLQKVLELFVLQLPLTETLDIWHPILALGELALGPANNIHLVQKIIREPLPGRAAPHVLVIEGFDDTQVPTNLQRVLVAAMGVDMVGPDVGPPDEQVLETIEIAGGVQLAPPVALNRAVPGQGDRTVAVVRYLQDFTDGHYVVFQLEEPKHQYGCFLETLAATGTPTIVEGVAQGAPCGGE